MSEKIEIEAKFEVPNVAELLRLPSLVQQAGGWIRQSRQVSMRDVYFDTDGQALRRSGHGCRMRRVDGTTWFTLKSQEPLKQGLASRTEWEVHMPGKPWMIQFPSDWEHDVVRRVQSLVNQEPLQAILEIRQGRTKYDLSYGAETRIEASADDVMILAGDREDHSFAVELEFVDGEPQDLAKLTQAIKGRSGWAPGEQSKLERGLTFLAEGNPGPSA